MGGWKDLVSRTWRRVCGWRKCPTCGAQSVRWVQVPVVFIEEPPMFGYWTCDACGAETPVTPTAITKAAAAKNGLEDKMRAMTDELQNRRRMAPPTRDDVH